MPGLLPDDSLARVVHAWKRTIRFDPLLTRVPMPDLLPFAVAFNGALIGDDSGELVQECTTLARASIDAEKVIRVSTFLAATIADEVGSHSGATTKSIVSTLGIVCEHVILTMVGDQAREASRDALTGLGNRRAWDRDLSAAAGRGQTVAVASIDLDGLKAINDNGGHAAGDAHLKSYAAALVGHLPPSVSAYRFGGDEYGLMCVPAEAVNLGQLLAQVASDFPQLAFSYGVASSADHANTVAIVELADQRMYEMKRQHKATLVPNAD